MILQTNKLEEEYLRKVKEKAKRSALIRHHLRLAGITQKSIAKELGVTGGCISSVISGYGKSKRVDNWLKENLGI